MRVYGLRRLNRRPGDKRDYVEWYNFSEGHWDTPHCADGDTIYLWNLERVPLTVREAGEKFPESELVPFDIVEDIKGIRGKNPRQVFFGGDE